MAESTDLVASAEQAFDEDNVQEALRFAQGEIELQPESAKAWFLKGKALFHLAEYVGASDAFKSARQFGIQGDDLVDMEPMMEEAKQKQILKAVKRDWYQTETHVIINVLIKKVKVDDISVDYGDDTLDFAAKIPQSDVIYELKLHLTKKIVKEQCVFKVTPSKIEIKLKKAEGYRWTDLESDGSEAAHAVKVFEVTAPAAAVPSYPTSAKKTKNWDKIEKEVKEEEKDEKLEGDAALNQLFQKIYGDASEETKRAMNKSFQESNGTVLSTNWGEIGAKAVDMQCPDGMEYKKY